MIEVDDYLCGLTNEIRTNAAKTVEKANAFLERAFKDGIPSYSPTFTSGWRPEKFNHLIPGSSLYSKHMKGEAIDLYDPNGFLAGFATRDNAAVLEELDLYIEDPKYTKGWLHLQIIPPGSGKRVFIPR